MPQATFWTRLSQWLKPANGSADGPHLPDILADGPDGNGTARRGLMSHLSKRQQREQTLEKLQAGYVQVAHLVGAIHKHLETQDRRSEQIAEALNRLAETTSRLPEAAQQQADKLADIAANIQAGNDRSRRWEQMLVDLPKIADAQREALVAIGRELQTGRQIDETMVQTVEHLRAAVTTWSDRSTAAAEAMGRLQETATQHDDRLAQLMTEQNRRFTWFLILTAVLALAATATAVFTLIK